MCFSNWEATIDLQVPAEALRCGQEISCEESGLGQGFQREGLPAHHRQAQGITLNFVSVWRQSEFGPLSMGCMSEKV